MCQATHVGMRPAQKHSECWNLKLLQYEISTGKFQLSRTRIHSKSSQYKSTQVSPMTGSVLCKKEKWLQRDSAPGAPCWIQAHDARLTSTCKLLMVVTLLWLQPCLAINCNSFQYCQRQFLILSSVPFLTWFSGSNFELFQTNSIQPLH